jgi:hypothetical protein
LDDAFFSAASDDEVLFEVKVTKTWLRQAFVALSRGQCRYWPASMPRRLTATF